MQICCLKMVVKNAFKLRMSYNLLDYSRGGGCGCKLGPEQLKTLLSGHNSPVSAQLSVGFLERDDAVVLPLNNGDSLVQSLDFFLPVVGNAYDFGQIAAANAISDLYAMGAQPISALSMLGWPQEQLPIQLAQEVLAGAERICQAAGITISGGHSIESKEPLFGLSVTGLAKSEQIRLKSTVKVGDHLYLSKPLGLGLMANGLKQKQLSEQDYQVFLKWSTQLNTLGLKLAELPQVSAMTDVTGFGLLGHLSEMLGKQFGADLELDRIPVFEAAKQLAQAYVYPNITTNNYNAVQAHTTGLDGIHMLWLCDPQTSGGLLVASQTDLDFPDLIKIGQVTAETGIRVLF